MGEGRVCRRLLPGRQTQRLGLSTPICNGRLISLKPMSFRMVLCIFLMKLWGVQLPLPFHGLGMLS